MLPPHRTPARSADIDLDEAIRQTDDDAAASRLSAINLGYLTDPYTSLLAKSPVSGPTRKPPLINVGTHHRTYAIDVIVDRFLERGGKQVVSLGAGSDTRFWRLKDGKKPPNLCRYVEIDFPDVTSRKAQRVSRSPRLSSFLNKASEGTTTAAAKPYEMSMGGTSLLSPTYALIPIDLRSSPSSSLTTSLLPHLDPTLPTLFLGECVFCYMAPEKSLEIIRWFGERFPRDTFGRVMRRNLASRHLSLPGAEPFRDTESQAARFLDPALGEGVFHTAGATSLWEIREGVIPPEELARIAKLEHLDEIEELRLVLSHYCVAWGTKGEGMEDIRL